MKKQNDQIQKAQLHKAVKSLETEVDAMFKSGRFEEYLKMLSQFHNYSFNNVILAFAQNPRITRIASRSTWKKVGMVVRKGETPIQVFCPVPTEVTRLVTETGRDGKTVKREVTQQRTAFKIGYVYDIAQCDGELPTLVDVPQNNSKAVRQAVIDMMKRDNSILFDPELISGQVNGFFSPASGEIHLKPYMTGLQTFRCLCHELAHRQLHGIHAPKDISREQEEIEAEAVSFLVCSSLGMEETISYSAGYIATWSKERSTKELMACIGRVEKAAKDILELITNNTDLRLPDTCGSTT